MKSSRRILSVLLAGILIFVLAQMSAWAQTAVAPAAKHCIPGHEDNGRMAVIRVLSAASSKKSAPTPKATASIRTNGSISAPVLTRACATETISGVTMSDWTGLDMLK